ncbi:MAG: DUF2029 domain-containing protein, partial [Alphaproteobacteria bacterium]|nr:DUF2029 domain-containing protein [Alphaproteobacteria bacterium]
VTLSYGAQAAAALMTLFGLVRIWRGNVATGYKGAALCLAALLVTPYSLDYDLMLLAPAIVLLVVEGTVQGFKDYERLSLAALWFVPAIARNVAQYTFIPLAVPAMAFCLAAIYLRCSARRLPAASGSQPIGMAL